MAISFKCGGCAKQYSVKSELAGKKAQCKKCGQVMLIPQMAAGHEPDLRDDGQGGGNANAETVAGSLISAPLDTMGGRSVSGQSVAGKSVSGRSMSGRSTGGQSVSGQSMSGRSASGQHRPPPPAYEPPPEPDFGEPPPLAALTQVEQSEHDAFEVEGGTEQKLRTTRGPAQRNRAPMEPFSFLILVALLGVLGYSAYAYMNATTAKLPPDLVAAAGKPTLAAVLSRLTAFVVTLAVVTPLVMAAWYGACKIVNFRLPPNLFMRSAGLAALPVMAMAVSDAVPFLRPNEALLALGTLPLAYVLLQFVHNQVPLLAGATVGLGAVAGAVGLAVVRPAQDNVEVTLKRSYDANVKSQQLALKAKSPNGTNSTNVAPTGPAVDVVAADAAINDLRGKLDGVAATLNGPNLTREKPSAAVEAVATAIGEAKTKFADRPEWADLDAKLKTTRDKVAALPTATPPAELAEAPPAGGDWTATTGGQKEVSAFGFNLTPPADGKFDLDAIKPDGPTGPLTWKIGEGRTTLTLESVKSSMANQQRPWVAPAFVVTAAEGGPVSVAADGTPPVEYGVINGLPAAKVTIDNGNSPKVVYTVHKGDQWVKATISPADAEDAAVAVAQAAVRSLRGRADGEPKLAPVSAGELVARFEGEPHLGDKIATLLKDLPAAEDTVVKAMGFAPDESTVRRFGPLLIVVATEKSSPALWQLANQSTPLGDKARLKLVALDPKSADEMAFALMDIKSSNSVQTKKGLSVLALNEIDKSRQASVSRALQNGVEDRSLFRGNAEPALEAVLGKYFDEDLGKTLQTVVENQSSPREDVRLSMRVLAATGKKKYVLPISLWALTDPNAVIETLSAMGPTAEVEVARYLNDPKVFTARKTWLAIIDRIGTQRSLSALQTCASKSGDAEVREKCKALILKINERLKSAPAR